jgi:hypothetical protein
LDAVRLPERISARAVPNGSPVDSQMAVRSQSIIRPQDSDSAVWLNELSLSWE